MDAGSRCGLRFMDGNATTGPTNAPTRRPGKWRFSATQLLVAIVLLLVGSPFIAELWKRCLDGASLSHLADWLNTKGVPSSHLRKWSRQTVFKLLRRRSYIGLLVDEATW